MYNTVIKQIMIYTVETMAYTAVTGCLSGTSEMKILRPLGSKLS